MNAGKMFRSLVIGGASLVLSACGTIANNDNDSGLTDLMDAGLMDAGPMDAGPMDAGPMDAGPGDMDAGPMDAGPIDAGPVDAGHSTPVDAGHEGTCVCTPDTGWPGNDCGHEGETAVCCWLDATAACCPG